MKAGTGNTTSSVRNAVFQRDTSIRQKKQNRYGTGEKKEEARDIRYDILPLDVMACGLGVIFAGLSVCSAKQEKEEKKCNNIIV